LCDPQPDVDVVWRDFARILLVKSLKRAGALPVALRIAVQSVKDAPQCAPMRVLLSDLVCRIHGDWELAALLRRPLQDAPTWCRDADFFSVNRQIFCGARTPESLASDLRAFAKRHLASFSSTKRVEGSGAEESTRRTPSTRQRIGLISPLFRAGPIYFLCIGALRYLAKEYDLIYFSRDQRSDWATEAFHSIAHEWHAVEGLSSDALATHIRRSALDALIDMSGWMDITVLRALGAKPAPLLLKWVGGQSASTGLNVFDAFISDEHQSPTALAHLYSEPLANMPGGYVTYTPPATLPEPQAPLGDDGAPVAVGVVSHPMKVSPAFVAYLAQEIRQYAQAQDQPVELQFIGWRYGEAPLQRRLLKALGLGEDQQNGAVRVSFVKTHGHTAQMKAMAALDWVVDTFPYTGGLTALESLALGVPIRTHAGSHCSARHAYSHARFAGLEPQQIDLQALGAFQPGALQKTGATLLPEHCPRKDHVRLARDMAKLLHQPAAL